MSTITTPDTRRRVAAAALLLGAAAAGAVATTEPGHAATRAKVSVTITAEGTDLSGTVLSKDRACEDERKVVVVRQVGQRGGEDDQPFASDTTEVDGGKGVWSTGNTGTAGRFYARVKGTPQCGKAESPTIRVVKSD